MYYNIKTDPKFKIDVLKNKNIIHIPSLGYGGTAVNTDTISRTLFDQRHESILFNTENAFYVTYLKFPKAENEYRQNLFGNLRPKHISVLDTDVSPLKKKIAPLDQAVLSSNSILNTLKEFAISHKDTELLGYNATSNMEIIAKKLDVNLLGCKSFAMWAGTKIGLQEFCQKYDITNLDTVSLYNIDDLRSGLDYLKDKKYEKAVIKVNHSSGGEGHKLIDIDSAINSLNEKDTRFIPVELKPDQFTYDEGMILQGWIKHDRISDMGSFDIFVDSDLQSYITNIKRKVVRSNDFKETGYGPISKDYKDQLLEFADHLSTAMQQEKAIGFHCLNYFILGEDILEKHNIKHKKNIFIHDENSRIGAGKIAQSWLNAFDVDNNIRNGWAFDVIKPKSSLKFSDLLAILAEHKLLINDRSEKEGVFVYDGGFLDNGVKNFKVLGLSKDGDYEKAKSFTKTVAQIFE